MYEMITGHGLFNGLTSKKSLPGNCMDRKPCVEFGAFPGTSGVPPVGSQGSGWDQNRRFATAGELLDALTKVRESSTPRLRPILLLGGRLSPVQGLLVVWVWLSVSLRWRPCAKRSQLGEVYPTRPTCHGRYVPGHTIPLARFGRLHRRNQS